MILAPNVLLSAFVLAGTKSLSTQHHCTVGIPDAMTQNKYKRPPAGKAKEKKKTRNKGKRKQTKKESAEG